MSFSINIYTLVSGWLIISCFQLESSLVFSFFCIVSARDASEQNCNLSPLDFKSKKKIKLVDYELNIWIIFFLSNHCASDYVDEER